MSLDWSSAALITTAAVTLYAAVVFITRVVGLRTFSKLDGFDLVVTIAVGSLIATTLVSSNPPLAEGLLALTALYAVRLAVAIARFHIPSVRDLMTNRPLLLVLHGEPLEENLATVRMTRNELLEKARAAGVCRMEQVEAMVMETTGDVSVLSGHGEPLDPTLLEGVRGVPPSVDVAPTAANVAEGG